MAIIKPPVLPIWADTGDVVQPTDLEIAEGWPFTNVPPARQRFNWILNFCANAVRYFSRRGVPDWDAAETYLIDDRIIGDDGNTYKSLANANINFTPSTNPLKWELWGLSSGDLAGVLVSQTHTYFTTTGTAPNYVLTPTQPLGGYVNGQRYSVFFHANGTVPNNTINVSGQGAIPLISQNSAGAFVGANIKAGMRADVILDGAGSAIVVDALADTAAAATTTDAGIVELATDAEAQTGTDTARALTPSNLGATVLGIGQTWQSVGRSAGTPYTNNTGQPILFAVSCDIDNDGAFIVLTLSGSGATFHSTSADLNDKRGMAPVFIPAGETYTFTTSAGTASSINAWELR